MGSYQDLLKINKKDQQQQVLVVMRYDQYGFDTINKEMTKFI